AGSLAVVSGRVAGRGADPAAGGGGRRGGFSGPGDEPRGTERDAGRGAVSEDQGGDRDGRAEHADAHAASARRGGFGRSLSRGCGGGIRTRAERTAAARRGLSQPEGGTGHA